ncbi:uncharacterized protein METZ01_LOCUS21446 [marine metagenome]|uniref:Uncharacterized protein n=1 Tax=marine metagenome TaxID=408172 RepID=A0A381PNJ3_9ZZZZ
MTLRFNCLRWYHVDASASTESEWRLRQRESPGT